MKTKILIATLLGCLVWQQRALSQTDTTATNPAATTEAAPAGQPAAGAATAPPAASATETPAATGAVTAPPPAPAADRARRHEFAGSARRQPNGSARRDRQQCDHQRRFVRTVGAGQHTLDPISGRSDYHRH